MTARTPALLSALLLACAPARAQWEERPPPPEPGWMRPFSSPALLPALGGALLGMGAGYGLGALVADGDVPVVLGVLGSTGGTAAGLRRGTGGEGTFAKELFMAAGGGVVGGAVGCLAGALAQGILVQRGNGRAGCALGFSAGQAYATVWMEAEISDPPPPPPPPAYP